MTLYHGSWLTVEKPDLSFSRTNVDFGRGFYTTPYKEQAKKWAERFKRTKGVGMVSAYELDDAALPSLRVLEFKAYNAKWLGFIADCRTGKPVESDYDIIAGSVANDKVFDTIEEYLNGYRTKTEALRRLRYEKPNWQYCFKNQDVMDQYLHFMFSEVVR
jgi:hypothetical protein